MSLVDASRIAFGPLKGPDRGQDFGSGYVWSAIGLVIPRGGSHRLYTEGLISFRLCRIAVSEAPVGQDIIVDVKRNLTQSIFAVPPRILVGQNTATAVPVVSCVPGDHLTVTVVQIGTTFAGRDLTVRLA